MRTRTGRMKKSALVAKVQMAPMIDMVFLLLVFFMCVSSISQAGLSVEMDLPDSRRSEVANDFSSRVTLSLDENGALFFNGVGTSEEDVFTELVRIAKDIPDLKLNIRSDRRTEYSEIRKVIQVAAKAGIYDYVYATYQVEL